MPVYDEADESHDSDSVGGGSETNFGSDAEFEVKEETSNNVENHLGKDETKAVRNFRILFLASLIGVAAVSSLLVFLYTKNTETTEFENTYQGHGNKVLEAFQEDSYRKMQALESLSSTVTSYALDNNLTWPFVTVANSARVFNPYLSLADAASLLVMPIVSARQRADWEFYSSNNLNWIEEDLAVAKEERRELQYTSETEVSPYIKNYVGVDTSTGPWAVWWQYAPCIPNRWFVNFNRASLKGFKEELDSVEKGMATVSPAWSFEPGLDLQSTRDFKFTQELLEAGSQESYQSGEPLSYIEYPIFDNWKDSKKAVAVLSATIFWKSYFTGILPDNVKVLAVVENTKGQVFTYELDGAKATYLGFEDLHDPRFDHLELSANYASFADNLAKGSAGFQYTGVGIDENKLAYSIRVYPSADLENEHITNRPFIYMAAMIGVFLFCVLLFLLYNWFVERRQRLVMTTAVNTTKVVSSLFPEAVRDRLLDQAANEGAGKKKEKDTFMNKNRDTDADDNSPPIADFYPETTILFSDIRGFTAWCSEREPAQVFYLLETLYGSFDKIARRRGVFKVETVGDCYVAVCGLPQPRKNHSVVMCRFARDCLFKMTTLFHQLETSLGPGTGDLSMRFGLHSGPITGGVIRGDNARFQLFGDTMNTASRMESTGEKGRIQISEETAKLLSAAGKGNWYEPRETKVMAKGKGELQTYWLKVESGADTASTGMTSCGTSSMDEDTNLALSYQPTDKITRLIKWNVELLARLLKPVVAQRHNTKPSSVSAENLELPQSSVGDTVRDHVSEVIVLPKYKGDESDVNSDSIELDPVIMEQLFAFVQSIAAMYQDNPFHNFEHASHVTMGVSKLLSRIISPDIRGVADKDIDAKLKSDHSYGITSDPLTQFACVFAALVHDVDHQGVTNPQLGAQNPNLAALYDGKSLAEQNSVDLTVRHLMDESFTALRTAIFDTKEEMERFYHLVVNSIIATDIFDPNLKASRNARWDLAFGGQRDDTKDRKATIVIEHLIQASDVVHTMQHWHVYVKWTEKLFQEMYQAYKNGKFPKNPADFWYQGELAFFDTYVIPLAKKLGSCGVFGVSGDEYLKYAEANREEWELRGNEVVAGWLPNDQEGRLEL